MADSARAPEPTTSQLTLWSQDPSAEEWNVRESARARRLAVRVLHSGRVEVVVPRRTSARTVERFLNQHRDWIERKRKEALRRAKPAQPFPPAQIELSACGQTLRVHLAGGKGHARAALLAPGLLGISGAVDNRPAMGLALQRWLMLKAKQILEPMLAQVAQELQVGYGKVVIRRQRTRWGSCSARGTISLNCCLLFQRPEVVRYLLVHELAHTVHMNHSKRFWAFVARHCREFQELDRELVAGWQRVPGWAGEA